MNRLRALPGALLPRSAADPARRRLLLWAIALLASLLLAGLWTWSPLRDVLDPQVLGHWLGQFRNEPWLPPLVLVGFLLAGLLMLPVTLMIVLTAVAFGPVLGFVYALAFSTVSAALSFLIGRRLGHRHVERLTGGPVHDLSRRIGRHGFLTIAVLRTVPVAHFTVVSMAAGTSHIRPAAFIGGTVVGMVPGMLLLISFLDSLARVARQPDPGRIAVALALAAGLLLCLLLLRRWLRRRRRVRDARSMAEEAQDGDADTAGTPEHSPGGH